MQTTAMLSLNIALVISVVAIILLTVGSARNAKRSQDRLIQSLPPGSTESWFRINVSRTPHFRKLFKLVGFEARGLLINAHDHIRILAELPSGERLDKSYAKSSLDLKWLGNSGIASSNMHWIAIGSGGEDLMITADTGFNAIASREATADICRMIDPHFALPENAKADFALEKNPASLFATIAFFVLLAFAFIDGLILNHNELLSPGNALKILPVFALSAFPFYWWLTSRKVPSRESLTLSMLLSLAIIAAYVPAIKRIDQWLGQGSQTYAYRLESNALLAPESSGPPKMNFSHRKEYWAQFEEGSTHYFDLIHGPLGLWQLDHEELDKKLRKFYENTSKADVG